MSLGGGISFFAARYGFVCDNVRNFEVVLGNGTLTSANTTHNLICSKASKAELEILASFPSLISPFSVAVTCGAAG